MVDVRYYENRKLLKDNGAALKSLEAELEKNDFRISQSWGGKRFFLHRYGKGLFGTGLFPTGHEMAELSFSGRKIVIRTNDRCEDEDVAALTPILKEFEQKHGVPCVVE
ncbi:Uncharacterised protein [Candidatus Gugararchaeum adminiculabundum]|nr:Uncharacterised protein [Candidatus Gugararchaeum adminiculabundum]